MKELYTITILGNLSSWATIFAVISCFAIVIFCIAYLVCKNEDCEKETIAALKKHLKTSITIFLITLIPSILIPNKEELYVIYGVGNAIDYMQDNPEAKALPDKTVKFLNAVADDYLNKYNSDEDEKRKEN